MDRSTLTDATDNRQAIAIAVCIVATIATARVAATIYERSILRTGARVRDALRSQASA